MCGSGTIAIEAAMIARRIPPGLNRDFSFLHWADADADRWSQLLAHARGQIANGSPVRIAASDRDAGAIEAARSNAERAGVAGDVDLTVQALSAAQPVGKTAGAVLVNPPYGERIGKTEQLRDLYAQLGNIMRGSFAGWTLGVLSADRALDAQMQLDLVERFATSNGGIPVRFLATQPPAK
jgi:putative N6-adenine-specific DNA methylase